MTIRLPRWTPGQRIGLMGGSFNPAHEGHLLASRLALRRLKLDRLWWLVTPGNPLKPIDGLPPLAARILAAQAIARDPRIALTGFEAEIGAHYTYDSIVWLLRRAPTVRFVWIMGADNLLQFHLWRRWREMAQLLPIAVVDRPGSTLRALNSQAGGALAPFRVPEREAAGFAARRPPAIIFLHGPRSNLSSSAIRRVWGQNYSENATD
jgi:nicotinate-nucleotide adenylyltransferase